MKKYFNPLNIVFSLSLTLTVFLAFNYIPREVAFLILALYLFYVLTKSLNSSVALFLRSIPFFIALPITVSFDNFDMGRLILFVIFLKWVFQESGWIEKAKNHINLKGIKKFIKENKIESLGILFFTIVFISLFIAPDYIDAIKRLIYLLNASFLFIVIKDLIKKDKSNFKNFTKNFAYSGILAVIFGYIQFISAYTEPAWVFHHWWGQIVSGNLYGRQWADIVTNFGNTWFSYSGDTLRLRMFSSFPDSHSFPMYVIMTLPSIFVLGFSKVNGFYEYLNKKVNKIQYRFKEIKFFILIALINLALILTGTRGIWLSGILAISAVLLFKLLKIGKRVRKFLLIFYFIFLLMFPVYFGVVNFRQFQDSDSTASASLARLRSLIDFGETSNSGRIYIWKETLKSIKERPLLGVGIGNYPTVLDEEQSRSLAGASAHNLYLDIASTVGVLGLAFFLAVLFSWIVKAIKYLKNNVNSLETLYVGVAFFSLAWILLYSMTDAALYDWRALLAFMTMLGMSQGILKNSLKI